MEKMTKDTVSVFQKYADLMTYEPIRPDSKFKFNPKKMKHGIDHGEYVARKDWDKDEDDEEEFDEEE